MPARLIAWLLLAATLSGVAASARAATVQTPEQRRFAVELRLIAGDLRRLREERLSPLHRGGLTDRVAGALGYLGLLGRAANQAAGHWDTQLRGDVQRLRDAFDAGRLDAMAPPLGRLLARYPLSLDDFAPDPVRDPARLALGRDIHQDLCLGCHLAPNPAVANPARDLFADARHMTREEFVARLMGGVRGVPATTLANPLSDEELRSLYVWYRSGPKP